MSEPPIDLLKAIAHPLRHAILRTIASGVTNVGEIETATGIGQPTLSQQLSVLRAAGLVVSRREAKLVFYSIAPEALENAIACLEALHPKRKEERSEDGNEDKPLTGAAVFARLD